MSTKPATALLEATQVKSPFPDQARESAERSVSRSEINISGNKVLLALTVAFLLTNGLIWAFVRYWLFAP